MMPADFYSLGQDEKKWLLEAFLGNKGKCISVSGGKCGEIYLFDQGENVSPRYVCAKLPKGRASVSLDEVNASFVKELRIQLSFYSHMSVHWAFDFLDFHGIPVALFRYWDSDLEKMISDRNSNEVEKLSIMVYVCSGLIHCYNNGLTCHQDLKPANIFLRNIKKQFLGLKNPNIYNIALIADFGLADLFLRESIFDGTRPYMAPEQWLKTSLSPRTDVFALGVILFELFTDGFHPCGIKLRDCWPEPNLNQSKKWTRETPWKQWATNTSIINFDAFPMIEPEIRVLIQSMLSIDAPDRPSIEVVKLTLLNFVQKKFPDHYAELSGFDRYLNQHVPDEGLKNKWPALWEKWQRFQIKFDR